MYLLALFIDNHLFQWIVISKNISLKTWNIYTSNCIGFPVRISL